MSTNDVYTSQKNPMISRELFNNIQNILAELTARLEGLEKKVSADESVFCLTRDMTGEWDYQQPIYSHRRMTTGKVNKELAFVLHCRSDLGYERRYLASHVLDQVAAEFRALLFENGEGHLDVAISSAKDKAREILLSTNRLISAEMRECFGFTLHNLDLLSLTEYEKERASGSLLFFVDQPSSGAFDWRMSESNIIFEESNLRTIRKLLAGVTPDASEQTASALVFVKSKQAAVFHGAAPLLANGAPPTALCTNSVQVTIFGPLKWELSICGCPVLRKEGNDLRFPVATSRHEAERKKDEKIREALAKVFDSVEKMDQLVDIIRAVEKQRHGAAILVAEWQDNDVCEQYIENLFKHNKALPVSWGNSKAVRNGVITNASKMDGAILADVKSCKVIALAAIVQATTCTEGMLCRGSRYNSINNVAHFLYKRNSETVKVIAFVFSSDGGMDILSPNIL